MKRSMSLGKNLALTIMTLVLLPMLIMGTINLVSLRQFGLASVSQSEQALERNAKQSLAVGSKDDRNSILEFATLAEVDARKLAQSSTQAIRLHEVVEELTALVGGVGNITSKTGQINFEQPTSSQNQDATASS